MAAMLFSTGSLGKISLCRNLPALQKTGQAHLDKELRQCRMKGYVAVMHEANFMQQRRTKPEYFRPLVVLVLDSALLQKEQLNCGCYRAVPAGVA